MLIHHLCGIVRLGSGEEDVFQLDWAYFRSRFLLHILQLTAELSIWLAEPMPGHIFPLESLLAHVHMVRRLVLDTRNGTMHSMGRLSRT